MHSEGMAGDTPAHIRVTATIRGDQVSPPSGEAAVTA
jgi:hypothetical protein